MALIDSNDFITHLVWRGLIDKATCGELKEAIELCTVKDTFSKADMAAMLTELKKDIEGQCKIPNNNASAYDWNNGVYACYKVIQEKINALRGEEDGNDK